MVTLTNDFMATEPLYQADPRPFLNSLFVVIKRSPSISILCVCKNPLGFGETACMPRLI